MILAILLFTACDTTNEDEIIEFVDNQAVTTMLKIKRIVDNAQSRTEVCPKVRKEINDFQITVERYLERNKAGSQAKATYLDYTITFDRILNPCREYGL